METIKISYSDFLFIKSNRYSSYSIKQVICKYCNCSISDIDDFEFNYGLIINVWLLSPDEEEL